MNLRHSENYKQCNKLLLIVRKRLIILPKSLSIFKDTICVMKKKKKQCRIIYYLSKLCMGKNHLDLISYFQVVELP